MTSALRTLLRLLGGLVLGVATGVAAVAVHQYVWGLALAVGAALAVALFLRPGAARLAMAAGLAAVVLRGSLVRPEGDYLVLANGPGWMLIGGAFALLLWAGAGAALAGARRPAGGEDRGESQRPT